MILLSPSKNLNDEVVMFSKSTDIRFPKETKELLNILKTYSPYELMKLMSVSQKLAELNTQRYSEFSFPLTNKNAKPSIHFFTGEVYRGLSVNEFSGHDINYAQKKLRILSGLYGLLRPLDLMHAYRLEMGIPLANQEGKNLYLFWGSKITDLLNKDVEETKSNFILNLASQEYWKSIQLEDLNIPVIDVQFKEWRNDKWVFISFTAKRLRGKMAKYVIQNRIKTIKGLKAFEAEGYQYNKDLSSKGKLFFSKI